MATKPVSTYQAEVARRLGLLHGVEVKTEWRTMAEHLGLYSPRLDIAVGPFATGNHRYSRKFNELMEQSGAFAKIAYELHNENLQKYGEGDHQIPFEEAVTRNRNSRCFLAIEIENQVSRKHLMGGAINAAALGRIGIAVGWVEEKVKALVKLRSYLLYLSGVRKNTFHPVNLFVLSKEQLLEAISRSEEMQVHPVARSVTHFA